MKKINKFKDNKEAEEEIREKLKGIKKKDKPKKIKMPREKEWSSKSNWRNYYEEE